MHGPGAALAQQLPQGAQCNAPIAQALEDSGVRQYPHDASERAGIGAHAHGQLVDGNGSIRQAVGYPQPCDRPDGRADLIAVDQLEHPQTT